MPGFVQKNPFPSQSLPRAGGRGTVPGPKGQLRTGKSSSAGILAR